MQHDIIDNRSVKLVDTIKTILPGSQAAKFAVGYFFVSGLEAVRQELANVGELRLLIGNTSNRETIEQIAEGYRRLVEVEEVLERIAYQKRAMDQRIAAETAENIGDSVALMDQTDEAEELISTLISLISEGRLKVRVYTKGRLHAKAYIFDYAPMYDAQGKLQPRLEKGIALVGSSNFTLSGITHNTELNVVVHGNENHAELSAWFEALWAEAEPFDTALMNELQNSWSQAIITPYELYLKTLFELVRDRLEEDTTPIWTGEIMGALTDFQLRAVERAIRIIRQYNGCFISDVVGLGKSYIGAAIVKHFERTERARPLIICPAPLVDQWEGYSEAYNLNARVLSMGMLRLDDDSGVSVLDDIRYRDRDFVLIDESHNFRNTDTQRYRVMEAFLARGRRCVLLTATPRNRSVWDIYHQLKLFHPSDRTELPIDPPDLRSYFELAETGERPLPALLSNILIRRTRTHVMRWFGYDAETRLPVDPDSYVAYRSGERRAYVIVSGRPCFFPRRTLETVDYNIEATYGNLYDRLRGYLGSADTVLNHDPNSLTYARYGLGRYVVESKRERPPYAELQRAGANLRGLMRISLFKRLESSVHAFRETIRRQLNIHRAFMAALSEGIIAAGDEAQEILYQESDRYDEASLVEMLERASGRYRIDDFDLDALCADMEQDTRILEEILAIVEPITGDNDAKLQALLAKLAEPEIEESKCLIFTQYADTAAYLNSEISRRTHRRDMAVVYSGHKDKTRLVGRFAPRANPAFQLQDGEAEINLMIATDVLSEGLNLQDANIVINYDLHWNPVRLIQRFGRVDRIGSEHDQIYGFNFLPETGLDEHLGLRDRLASRIREIHETIGEDAAVLDPSEQINEEAMYVIYSGGDLSELEGDGEDEFIDLEEAEEAIRQIQRDQPSLFHRIAHLKDGIRCARESDVQSTFVFCRTAGYQQLYLLDAAGEVVSREVPYILGKLRCEADEPPIALPPGHNGLVTSVKRQFEHEVQSRRAESQRALSLTRAQKYIARELSLAYSQTDDEAVRSQISALDAMFRQPLPKTIHSQLNDIRNQAMSGELLIDTLLRIYERHDLSSPEALGGLPQSGDVDTPPRIICSEALLVD